jgi:SAM-dependent methyltransferase
MGRFGDNPLAFFDTVYADAAPWDIGRAQPAMARLLEDFPPQGPILDLGSGSGDLAIHLAMLGHRVVGVDFVDKVVARARQKASGLAPEVAARLSFQVADAGRPSALGGDFRAVVDCGFLHLFEPDEAERFVEDLGRTLPVSGRYYLHELAIEFPIDNVPRAITRAEIDARFNKASGWRVLDVRDVEFLNRVGKSVASIAACIERL